MVNVDKLFGSRKCVKILNFFLERPNSEFNQSEVRKNLDVSKVTAAKWLDFLVKNKILLKNSRGRMIFYSLNREDPTVKQLKILFTVTELKQKLERTEMDSEVYLFGSAARGEDTKDSDIDLLVVGKDREIIEKLKSLDSRIKVSFFTPVEWLKTEKEDRAFYERVEKDKIRLV